MPGQTATLTFGGDASALQKAAQAVNDSVASTANAVGDASNKMRSAATDTQTFAQSFSSSASGMNVFADSLDGVSTEVSRLSGAVGDIGGTMTSFTDLQNYSSELSDKQAQAQLNAERAQQELNKAIKEFGPNSLEAREAQLAFNQAQADTEPPSNIQQWGEKLELLSPIIMGVVGVSDLLLFANNALTASWIRTSAANVAAKASAIAGTAATGIATAAQWAWNVALTANPIGIVIVAIGALVAAIIWIATQTTWFQTIWEYVWNFLKEVGGWFAGPFVDFFVGAWNNISGAFSGAVNWIKNIASGMQNYLTGIPGRIVNAFASIAWTLSAPFRAAFNYVSDAWNNTIGRLSWSVPGWVPGIGGNSISVPKLPHFHTGVRSVPGAPGQEMLAVLQAGERVTPASANGEQRVVIELKSDGSRLSTLLIELIQESVEVRGGSSDNVFGVAI